MAGTTKLTRKDDPFVDEPNIVAYIRKLAIKRKKSRDVVRNRLRRKPYPVTIVDGEQSPAFFRYNGTLTVGEMWLKLNLTGDSLAEWVGLLVTDSKWIQDRRK